jgi:hypothetical protein
MIVTYDSLTYVWCAAFMAANTNKIF